MRPNKQLLQALKKAIKIFESDDSQQLKIYEASIDGKLYRFYGVHAAKQSYEQVRLYRAEILKLMGLAPDMPIIQVIGDSATFGVSPDSKHLDSLDRLGFAREVLNETLNNYPNHAVLYGFTGKSGDVNTLVNEWLADNQVNLSHVIGNAVSVHTPMAIENWGCDYGDIQNITVVYPDALFGADVNLSDQFVRQHDHHPGASFGLCLEGGVQSFLQMINMLNLDIPILAVEKLRGPANAECKYNDNYLSLFSATEFMSLIKNACQEARAAGRVITREEIELIRNQYLYIPEIHGEYDILKHHHLHDYANPARGDYSTKKGLFAEAFTKFFEMQIWKKLNLLTVINGEKILEERAALKQKPLETYTETNLLYRNTFSVELGEKARPGSVTDSQGLFGCSSRTDARSTNKSITEGCAAVDSSIEPHSPF